jgi:hypothetical protein
MPDQPTRAAIRDALLGAANLDGAAGGPLLVEEADHLADAVMEALATTGLGLRGALLTGSGEGLALPPITQGERTAPGVQWVGPFLTPEELAEIRQRNDGASGAVTRLLAHVDAQADTIANQDAELDPLRQRVEQFQALQTELPRALYLTPLDEVMGHKVMAAEVKLIAEVLRAAQAEREGRRG